MKIKIPHMCFKRKWWEDEKSAGMIIYACKFLKWPVGQVCYYRHLLVVSLLKKTLLNMLVNLSSSFFAMQKKDKKWLYWIKTRNKRLFPVHFKVSSLFGFVFFYQFADFPVGWQRSRWAAQWAGFPPKAELLRPFIQPVQPCAPGPGAAGLHGEVVYGWKQPGKTLPAELQTAPCQTHRSKVPLFKNIFKNSGFDDFWVWHLATGSSTNIILKSLVMLVERNVIDDPCYTTNDRNKHREEANLQADSTEPGNHLPAVAPSAFC